MWSAQRAPHRKCEPWGLAVRAAAGGIGNRQWNLSLRGGSEHTSTRSSKKTAVSIARERLHQESEYVGLLIFFVRGVVPFRLGDCYARESFGPVMFHPKRHRVRQPALEFFSGHPLQMIAFH